MTSARPELPSDNVQAYIPSDRRRALAAGTTMAEHVEGAALFADISGFTALTEALALELGPQRGAEELTATLDTVVAALLDGVERHGGSVIYFSGDAVTCWLDGDDGHLAIACGLHLQETMRTVGDRTTPGGRRVQLRLKVAVAVGAARRFVVGDPNIQLIDVLAGGLLAAMSAAEHLAQPGETVIDAGAMQALGDRVRLSELRGDELGPAVGVVEQLVTPAELPPALPRPAPLPDEIVRQWLLPAVYERLSAGHGEFLAELRPAVPLFLRFGGIDFDTDPDAPAKLNALVVRAQHVVDANGGNVMQLTIGDKGAYLYAVFGAPIAHEDDAARACSSGLELLRLGDVTAAVGPQVGVASGQLRSGTYGSAERRTFCCLGDAVNLAARLMSAAPPGEAYVSGWTRRAAGDAFSWEELPPLLVKGKAAPVNVSALRGARRPATGALLERHTQPMIGREIELATLEEHASNALAGAGQVVVMTADAGLGKSRLLAALARRLASRGSSLHLGSAPAFGASSSYGAWQEVWRSLFGVAPDDPPEQVAATLSWVVGETDSGLLPRLPLLGALVGVPLPDTALTATFDAKLRKTSLETLVVQYLAARSPEQPVFLALEDSHWLDPLSVDLLQAVSRAAARLPMLLVLTRRPLQHGADLTLPGANVHALELGELDAESTRVLAESWVAALTGEHADQVPAAVLEQLVERAHGNPFHLEELLSHLVDRGVDLRTASPADLDLPTSLRSLVLTRIDDLPESPRRTLKVASVIGRHFGVPVLTGTYPSLGDPSDVAVQLVELTLGSLVAMTDPEDEDGYDFRHAMTEEVAYESLPYALRSTVHDLVGDWLERHYPGGPDQIVDLLAYHFDRGTDRGKKREYLIRAGIAAQARYANESAVSYYRRALEVVEDDERAELLQRLAKVQDLQGGWIEAESSYAEALALRQASGDVLGEARTRTELADVLRKQGRFDDASAQLAGAQSAFAAADDQPGLGRVLHLEGTLASQQGRYDEAQTAYETSLQIRERLDDRPSVGALLSNLAVVAECVGDFAGARRLNEQSLAVREEVGDPWAICVSQNNLGMIALLQEDYAAAKTRIEESMRLATEVGDPWIVSVGHHNLGNAFRGLGSSAESGAHFLQALATYEDYDDRWSLAMLAEDVALLAAGTGQAELALALIGGADALREALAAPRAPAAAEVIDAALAPARLALGTQEAATRLNAGRLSGAAALIATVRAVCEHTGG